MPRPKGLQGRFVRYFESVMFRRPSRLLSKSRNSFTVSYVYVIKLTTTHSNMRETRLPSLPPPLPRRRPSRGTTPPCTNLRLAAKLPTDDDAYQWDLSVASAGHLWGPMSCCSRRSSSGRSARPSNCTSAAAGGAAAGGAAVGVVGSAGGARVQGEHILAEVAAAAECALPVTRHTEVEGAR